MSLLDFLISPAAAQAAPAAGQQPSMIPTFVMLGLFFVLMYFMMIRPQMKRQKEHKAMLDKLSRGDEVLTSGGLAGVVTDIGDNFVTIEVADNVRVRVQKSAVGNVLPKGSLKAS